MMNWLWVALGGGIGASLRYGLGLYLIRPHLIFPWPTWWINITGCFLAGVFFAFSQKYVFLQNEMRLFLMVGILGGFTTFSSFGLETFQLFKQGEIFLAFSYMVSSVIIGMLVLALVFYLCHFILHHPSLS